ncbi:MAG: biotin--[acetyl-CoA-carboxylase] ligase [Planctomycetaceae bacterium]|nr:biotin--[acetyl-CoA-carboxylase] ligase [Planctomycetaceae bacterium]
MSNIELCELLPIRAYEYHKIITSTNDKIRDLINNSLIKEHNTKNTNKINNPKLPCLVVAREQTAGRGRGNKCWWSGVGGLMMSFGLELGADYFPINREVLPQFSPIVGEIVADVLKEYIPPQNIIEIRQPNDIYINNKKIGGILIESPTPNFAIIGIGININNSAQNAPITINHKITTIFDLTGKKTDLRKILLELVAAFFDRICRSRYGR